MPSRRLFFKSLSSAAAFIAFAPRNILAAAGMVDINNPTAKALGYVEDAAQADKKKFPNFVAGSRCDNCNLYVKVDEKKGSCTIFQNQLVTAEGWCASWIKKQD